MRISMAFRIAYSIISCSQDQEHQSSSSEARKVSTEVQNVVEKALLDLCGGGKVMSCTQTSIASQRHHILSQEDGIASVGDFLVMSLRVPSFGTIETNFERKLLEKARTLLNDIEEDSIAIKLLSCIQLSADINFHAEKDCTQRIYHYLLPLSWLPQGDELESWWLQNKDETVYSKRPKPPSDSLRRLRDALRSAQSPAIPNRKIRRRMTKSEKETTGSSIQKNTISTSRQGAFTNKERRPWHNFANTQLRGDASPNQEPVWRVLDKARIYSYMAFPDAERENNQTVVAILEFRGDDFVQGQIRSIVATALAITHGWLPTDTFGLALQKEIYLETPIAPKGRLYSAGARFHFYERKLKSENMENDIFYGSDEENNDVLKWIHENLIMQQLTNAKRDIEKEWLKTLEGEVAPRISHALKADSLMEQSTTTPTEPIQDVYSTTLKLLRSIVASGAWPVTSTARAAVIREVPENERHELICRTGSFTVFNTKFDHFLDTQSDLPLGNKNFPDLVEAVFELEEHLSTTTKLDQAGIDGTLLRDITDSSPSTCVRPPSYCCAINFNAQFTPHVDSGRGSGQTLSMIVGLGDYLGGELFVEGHAHDIRYKPLQFDGWSSRHWTNQYAGERFSLVWFTPETSKTVSAM